MKRFRPYCYAVHLIAQIVTLLDNLAGWLLAQHIRTGR